MTVQDRVHELLAPIVATLRVELLDVEFTGGTLRVTIDAVDRAEAVGDTEAGVTTETLAEVNRLISPVLDQHDPVPGRYTLEVSSPGLERPLKRAGHYRRAVGEEVIVKLAATRDPRRVKGRLAQVVESTTSDPETVEIVVDAVEIDGVELDEVEVRRFSIADVATARTVFEWGPSPKPGGKNNKRAKKGTAKKNKAGVSTAEKSTAHKSAAEKSTAEKKTAAEKDHPGRGAR